MRASKFGLCLTMFVITLCAHAVVPQEAEAGPLMDWLRSRCARKKASQLQPAAGCTTCTQTCQRVVASYVPYTAYRTCYEQVPVTYYQQTTSVDPCTGCQITCNRPCTTYRQQAKRVPYTAYRTVYRTETFQTPVTPAYYPPTGCSSCSAAAPGFQQVQSYGYQTVSPATYQQIQPYAPSPGYDAGGYSTETYGAPESYNGGYEYQSEPADLQPSIDPNSYEPSTITNKPTSAETGVRDSNSVIREMTEQYEEYKRSNGIELTPADSSVENSEGTKTSFGRVQRNVAPNPSSTLRGNLGRSAELTPTHRDWNYSPRLASYREPVYSNSGSNESVQRNSYGQSRAQDNARPVNQGWNSGR